MQYLVHVEINNYFLWQAYILAESFQMLGLQENLVIAYSNPDERPIPFLPAISFECQNIGKEWDCGPATKFFAAYAAQKAGVIKQPFVLFDPDSIIRRAVAPCETPMAAQKNKFMSRANLELVHGYAKLPSQSWYPVSSIYQFKDVPIEFFEDTLSACKYVVDKFKPGDNKLFHNVYNSRADVGVALGIGRSGLKCDVVNDYQSSLDQRREDYEVDANFINYSRGYLPYFHKGLYDDQRPMYRSSFPFVDISQIPDHKENEHVALLKQVVSSFTENHKDYFTS